MLHKVIGYRTKIVVTELVGQRIFTTEGTIVKTEYDDAWFYALCNHHHDIFDIGANVGYSSILGSLDNPGKRIVLVDPNPLALTNAAGNLIRNNMSLNKTFLLAFVSEKSGEKVKFYTVGTGAAGSMFATAAKTANKINSYSLVDTLTIDDIMVKTSIVPDLVKIDIEGAESMALRGATKLATLQKAKFIVEMHSFPEMPMTKNIPLVVDWCHANGYKSFFMSQHRRITDPKDPAVVRRGRCHLLLIPENTEYPEYLPRIPEIGELPKR